MGISIVGFWRPLIVLYFVLSCFGCASESIQTNKVDPTNSLMRDDFWGTGDDSDLPAAFEIVCDPDPEKCGDTHFGANDDSYVISFQRFPRAAEAVEEFEKIRKEASREVRSGDVRNSEGLVVGRKIVLWQDIERYPDAYKLVWVRGNRLAIVSTEKFESINLYESDRGL